MPRAHPWYTLLPKVLVVAPCDCSWEPKSCWAGLSLHCALSCCLILLFSSTALESLKITFIKPTWLIWVGIQLKKGKEKTSSSLCSLTSDKMLWFWSKLLSVEKRLHRLAWVLLHLYQFLCTWNTPVPTSRNSLIFIYLYFRATLKGRKGHRQRSREKHETSYILEWFSVLHRSWWL